MWIFSRLFEALFGKQEVKMSDYQDKIDNAIKADKEGKDITPDEMKEEV